MPRRGRLQTLGLLAALAALSACGGGGTSAASSPAGSSGTAAPPTTGTGSSTATTASTASTTTSSPTALDPLIFPEKDTPIAQASTQLKAAWSRYKVTIVPGRHTLETMPTIAKVRNFTQGKVSDADAQQLLTAEYRDNTFVAWAELNIQVQFEDFLQLPVFAGSKENQAMKAGHPVLDPPCDLYPVSSVLVNLDQQSKDYFDTNFTKKGSPVTAQFALVQTYDGPCEITAMTPQGKQVLDSIPSGGATAVFPGHLQHDPVLGDLWFTEAAFTCGDPGVPRGICASVGV